MSLLSKKSEFKPIELIGEELAPNNIVFCAGDKTVLELRENGDIFVKGKLVENDKEVVDGMRVFLAEVTNNISPILQLCYNYINKQKDSDEKQRLIEELGKTGLVQ